MRWTGREVDVHQESALLVSKVLPCATQSFSVANQSVMIVVRLGSI